MTADLLARTLQEFLPAASRGVVVEQGEIIFDLESARHSVSSKDGRCLLHMWSAERNVVREIVNLEPKKDALYLSVRRFGQAKPHKLMICRERDQRTAVARLTARTQYARRLEKSAAKNEDRVALAFRLAYGREPTREETGASVEFVRGAGTKDRLTPWEQFAHAILASNEFLWID